MDKVKDGYLDYTYPEIMDYAVEIVREIAENYSVDGIFLDFMRTEENQTKDTLIEFIKRVRGILNTKKNKYGKNMRLSVRIPSERLEYYEAAKFWVKDNLVDIIVPSNASESILPARIEHYARIC